MTFLLQAARKRALSSLYSDQPIDLPSFEHGETVPLTVGKIDAIPFPLDSRIFEPQDISGWTFRAALGKGFLPPVAGVWFILSGINLTSGTLTTGKRYKIVTFVAGDSFTNVGAGSNATGVVFTATGTTPTTWTHASTLQEATGNITFAPTYAVIQTALDATAWVVAAGGLTVSGGSGFFYFTFTTAGARAQMTGDATNLAPLSIADFSTLIQGDSSLAEVQIVRLLQNPGAYCSLTLASTAPGCGISLIQAGGGGLNAKYRLSFATRTSGLLITGATYRITRFETSDVFTNVGAASNATGVIFIATGTTPTTWSNGSALSRIPSEATLPYDGQFSILVRGLESAMLDFNAASSDVVTALEGISRTSGTVVSGAKYKIVTFATSDDFTNIGGTNVTGNVFVASGTTPTTWTHGSVLSPVAAGNASVEREAEGQYLIAFQGDMANTAMGTLSSDGSALKVVQTLSGVLDLRTAAIDILLAGETSLAVVFEIEGTPPGGTVQKLFRQATTLLDSILDPSSTQPPVTSDGYAYIGQFARLVPIANGFKIQTSLDGITWDDGPSYESA